MDTVMVPGGMSKSEETNPSKSFLITLNKMISSLDSQNGRRLLGRSRGGTRVLLQS